MTTLQTIKNRINTISSLNKAMNAIKMVSTVKLAMVGKFNKNQQLSASKIENILGTFIDEIIYNNLFDEKHWVRNMFNNRDNTLAIVLSTSQGFCGSFIQLINSCGNDFLSNNKVQKFIVIGTKNKDLAKQQKNAECLNINLFDLPAAAKNITDIIKKEIIENKIGNVIVIHGEQKNQLTNFVKQTKIWPISYKERKAEHTMIIEGNHEILLRKILRSYINNKMQEIIFKHINAELSARIASLDSSTKNAKEIHNNLSILYNKTRQFKITKELTEIISSMESMK